MSFINFIAKSTSSLLAKNQLRDSDLSEDFQHNILTRLINVGEATSYWKENGIKDIRSYTDFKQQIPLVKYEDIAPYIERIKNGEQNVLWVGKPLYLAKTSGTTGANKYIPITKEFLNNHTFGAKITLLHYLNDTGNTKFYSGEMMFLTGSPKLDNVNGISIGRLSGIANYQIPWYLKKKYVPSFKTNSIEDWDEKITKIAEETSKLNLTTLSGIPPWLQMYFDRLLEITGKKVGEIFPNLSLIIYGGMSFEPYKQRFFDSIGRSIDMFETYATSEGYIACQCSLQDKGMLLQLDNDIFYEFVPIKTLEEKEPTRLTIKDVKLNEEYAIVLSTTAGLWGYILGDTIRFTSLSPYKIVITGRTKHFISAFGEHVTIEEVENAMAYALERHPETKIYEYTVAPHVGDFNEKNSYHEWLIEFIEKPNDMNVFIEDLNDMMEKQNCYYKDLIEGHVLKKLHIMELKKESFIRYLKSVNKYGEQNKIQRVSNVRDMAEGLIQISCSI